MDFNNCINNNTTLSLNNKNVLILYDIEYNIWFKADDICNILEHVNSKNVIDQYVDNNDIIKYNKFTCDLDNKIESNTTFININGVYSLISISKSNEVKIFKNWIINTVIPTIIKIYEYKFKKEKELLLIDFEEKLKIKNNIIDKQNNIINLMRSDILCDNLSENNNSNEFILIKKNNLLEYPYYVIISQKIKIINRMNKLKINYPELEILLRLNNTNGFDLYNKMKESLDIKYNGNHFETNIDESKLIYEICKLNNI